jgi:hypothetical protein
MDPYLVPPFIQYVREDQEPFRIFGLDGILYPNISTAYRLADIRWLNALIPGRMFDFTSRFIEETGPKTIRFTGRDLPISDRMFDLLNVKYVLSANVTEPGEDPGSLEIDTQPNFGGGSYSSFYELVYCDRDVLIYQNKDVSPRAFVVHTIINVSSVSDAFAQLENLNIDLRQTAVVENFPPELENIIKKNDDMQSEPGTANIIRSGELDVLVNTRSPGLLVVPEQYYPGWQATVDGKQAPIYAVNGTFRGIFLSAGNHMIKFEYRPLSFIVGSSISLLSLLFLATCLILTIRSNKNDPA